MHPKCCSAVKPRCGRSVLQPADIESLPVPDGSVAGVDKKIRRITRSQEKEEGFEAAPINVFEAGKQTAEHRADACGAEADFNNPTRYTPIP